MNVVVKFFGVLQDLTKEKERKVWCPSSWTIRKLYESVIAKKLARKLGAVPKGTAPNFPVLFAVNQEFVKPSHRLKDGDECAFIPPMSGG